MHLASVASHLPLKDLIFTVVAYRLYWNSPVAWDEFATAYGLDEKGGFRISAFDFKKCHDIAMGVKTKRCDAYLNGCGGRRGFARQLRRTILFIKEMVDLFGEASGVVMLSGDAQCGCSVGWGCLVG